ncbi:TIGR04255 family protein [Delftia tsuruhatensis]|uniref:TIGR04255 family protein n=2 Tax=Delftia tsuruhatensis TaxID=180282 RepID=UPI0039BD4B32
MIASRAICGNHMIHTEDQAPLPSKLREEVIVDAIFEIRFSGNDGLADLLPGMIWPIFDSAATVHRLPVADIPSQVRKVEQELIYLPTVKLESGNYSIFAGDRVFAVGVKLPYRGWDDFKNFIVLALNRINSIDLIGRIERYSLKYVNFLPDRLLSEPEKSLDWNILVAGKPQFGLAAALKSTFRADGLMIIREISTALNMVLNGNDLGQGTVISVDSLSDVAEPAVLQNILAEVLENLEKHHKQCKDLFFECISRGALLELGAE